MICSMSSVYGCTATLFRCSRQWFIPILRSEKMMLNTWTADHSFSRLKVKLKYGYHSCSKQKQLSHCTSYIFSVQNKLSNIHSWRNMWWFPGWRYAKYTSVYFNRLTYNTGQKNCHEPRNDCKRLLSDSKMTETRKRVSKKMEEIKENVLTVPNGLCLLRMVATPFLGYLVLQEWYATSLGLFIFAGCTDVVDGYIARTFPSQQSMIGSFLDPAADKILIATLFITLTVNGLIPVPLTSLIIFRDICLMGAGFYIRYVSLPPPKTLVRYFDMSFVTAKLSPTGISKANTLVQLSLVACSLAAPVFNFTDHIYLQTLWYITAVSTVLSAGSYLFYNKETYKVFASHMQNRKR